MKILHSADWHIGTFKSPEKNGVNLRTLDLDVCLDAMVNTAEREKPEFALVSGDIFDSGKLWSDRCCTEIVKAAHYIRKLSGCCGEVIVMRGTPNHDGNGPFELLKDMFHESENVHVVTAPKVLNFEKASVLAVPGFDHGAFRAAHPGLSAEEENEIITNRYYGELFESLGKEMDSGKLHVLMAHATVTGCCTEGGQIMMPSQLEPQIMPETLNNAGFDLVAMGHIHKPQRIDPAKNWFYCGAVNQMTFNDEGQERGFFIHHVDNGMWQNRFYPCPVRNHVTLYADADKLEKLMAGNAEAFRKIDGQMVFKDAITRVFYDCDDVMAKTLSTRKIEQTLLKNGAFMVWEVTRRDRVAKNNKKAFSVMDDPVINLKDYLAEKGVSEEDATRLLAKAEPVIASAKAEENKSHGTGMFVPVEISVKNYRNYVQETFDFTDIMSCTINGDNGSGKSSLFMDAILDCLYEEPREGFVKDSDGKPPWIRNDEKARSASIMFTFLLGNEKYRVSRSRTKSGKGTLAIAQFVDGGWVDISCGKMVDTQEKIVKILGMDSLTFKSCALIMQDEYALFPESSQEDRAEILATLLGLNVYADMEKASAALAKEHNVAVRDTKAKIATQTETIEGIGNPKDEIAQTRNLMDAASEKKASIDKDISEQESTLSILKEHAKTMDEKEKKKAKLDEKLKSCGTKLEEAKQAKADNEKLLAEKETLEKAAKEYESAVSEMHALEKEMAADAEKEKALEAAKTELDSAKAKGEKLATDLEDAKKRMKDNTFTEKDREDAENAKKLENAKAKLGSMSAALVNYNAAVAAKNAAVKAMDDTKADYSTKHALLTQKKEQLENRAALLENSGCVDIEKASCMFLKEAKEAKNGLLALEKERENLTAEEEQAVSAALAKVKEADAAIAASGYDEVLYVAVSQEVQQYAAFENIPAMHAAKKQAYETAEADSIRIQNEIAENGVLVENLSGKVKALETELEGYAGKKTRYEAAENKMKDNAESYAKLADIPLANERLKNAMSRITELETETASVKAELDSITVSDSDRASLDANLKLQEEHIAESRKEKEETENLIAELQKKCGALEEKVKQVAKLEAAIADLKKEIEEHSKEASDYEMLRAAFGQGGIPHQIIRSVIPQIEDTACQILSQMTRGGMGIVLKMDRVMKNGKEKPVLDLFVREKDGTVLPYKSRSGGEKVKVSLSVILALAETKSASAGISLGMLFIDEPPFLDADGAASYCDALDAIGQRYPDIKIMAVTHDIGMKARFMQNIDIIKDENGSHVVR